MAIFHLEFANGKVGKGLAHFNYITGQDKYEKRKKNEMGIVINNMPKWADTPQDFWLAADFNERENGRVYKEIRIALPNQFSKIENENLLKEFLEKELVNKYYYTAAIHNKDENGNKNLHSHIMICPRKRDNILRNDETFFKRYNSKYPERGGALKDSYWNKRDTLIYFRESWEETLNNALEKKNIKKVSCKSLKAQREDALLKGDLDLAEFLDREPINISGYLLKVPKEKLTEDEKISLEIFELNREIKNKQDYLYNLLQKAKELNSQKQKNLEDIEELNSNISNFKLKEKEESKEFGDIYDIQENILLLTSEKIYTENLIKNLDFENIPEVQRAEEDVLEMRRLNKKLLGLISELDKNNYLFGKEIEHMSGNNLFEEKYKKLNEKNFQRDFKRYYKTERRISKFQREIEENYNKINNIKNSALNILTKGKYGRILNKLLKIENELNKEGYVIPKDVSEKLLKEKEQLTIEKEKIVNEFNRGDNKNKLIRLSANLYKKYKLIIENKGIYLSKERILNKILLDKLNLENGNKPYLEILDSTKEEISFLTNKINKCNKQIDILKKSDYNSIIYNKIFSGKFSQIKENYLKNNEKINDLKENLKLINTFSFNKKNLVVKKIKTLEKENEKLNEEYKDIQNSVSKKNFSNMKEKLRIKVDLKINSLKTKIIYLKAERSDLKNVKSSLEMKLWKKLGANNSPNINSFIKNYKANLGEIVGGSDGIRIEIEEDVWTKRIRKELDFNL